MEFRTIDGSGNNLTDADLNAAATDFARMTPAHFADGIASLTGGPNPRSISNLLVGAGDASVANPEGVSGMMYAWGQFIDHDLTLTRSDGINHIDIAIPAGDPVFADGSSIVMTRAVIDPATGTDAQHPATAVDFVTGWLDASMVYGSNDATAASLRLADGHMKTSAGDNLPIVNGMFAAGDARAAENPSLTALQTLFVREHNLQVDRLAAQHPALSGDELYAQARAIVAAEIAHITYAEFLPLLLGDDAIAPYDGYDPNVDPRITLEFAGAAYRFGHSLVSAETERLNEDGEVIGPEQELRDTFFEPPADFTAFSGADGFLRHLGSDLSQALDARIVEDLRNFLVDPPAAMDLAAINIQRGHDLGLGTLNQTRQALGLAPYTDFAQITSDPETLAGLQAAYASVNGVGLWSGGLAEDHAPGALLGPTFQLIIARQFQSLRDGDRLWFENQGFDAPTLAQIQDTTLADVIRRNANTAYIQDNVFVFYERHAVGVAAEHPDKPQLIIGSDAGETLSGGVADDILVGRVGNDQLDGGGGFDTATFSATRAQYDVRIIHAGSGALEAHATHQGGAASEGSDTLSTMEMLEFTDRSFVMAGAQLNRSANLSGSRFDDVLFQNHATGQVYYAKMVDGAFQTWAVGTSPLGHDWTAIATGNVNPALTGGAEIFLQRQSTGAIHTVSLDAGSAAWGTVSANLTPDWMLRAVADLNGDASADAVVQNHHTGTIYYADMHAGAFAGWKMVTAALSADWVAVGAGDIDRDGFADVVVQSQSTGAAYYAKMANGVFAGWGTISSALTSDWQIKAVADVSGDGFADVVVQQATTGATYYADMANGAFRHWGIVTVGVTADWTVAGAADVDNDGLAEVVFQNATDGATYYAAVNHDGSGTPAWGVVATGITSDWHAV